MIESAAHRDLADRAAEANPFFAPGLLAAALTHMADRRVRVVAAQDEAGRPVALAPVVDTRLGRLVPAVSVWTHLHAPLGTPLLDRRQLDDAVERLLVAMDGDRPGRRILIFPFLPLANAAGMAIRAVAEAQGRPVAVLNHHHRAVYEAGPMGPVLRDFLGKKRRHELDRQRRRLGDLGRLEAFSVAGNTEAGRVAMQSFLALEASGWKGRGGTALAEKQGHRAFAETAMASGEGAMAHGLALDGRPVAMLISFADGGTALTWKIAHDETLARYSPGVQVMLDGGEARLAEPTVDRVDTLAIPGHPMVDPLFPGRMEIGTLVVGPVGGSAGFRLGVKLAEAEIAARPRVKALLRRR